MNPSYRNGFELQYRLLHTTLISHKDTQAKAPCATSTVWILLPWAAMENCCLNNLLTKQAEGTPTSFNLFECFLSSWVNSTSEDIFYYSPLGCPAPATLASLPFLEHSRESSTPGPLYLSFLLSRSSLPDSYVFALSPASQIFVQTSPSQRVPSLPTPRISSFSVLSFTY